MEKTTIHGEEGAYFSIISNQDRGIKIRLSAISMAEMECREPPSRGI